MKNMQKWKKGEDRVIKNAVKKSPTNLKLAFELASTKLNRSKYAVKQRWYNVLRDGETIFTLVSGNKVYNNIKNVWNRG